MHFPGALIAPTVSILHLQSESGSLAPRDRCSRSKECWSFCWELHSVVHGCEGNVFCRKETLEVGSPPFLMPSSPPFFDAHVCSLRKLWAASQKLAELREHEQRWMLKATHCRTCQFWALCHCIFYTKVILRHFIFGDAADHLDCRMRSPQLGLVAAVAAIGDRLWGAGRGGAKSPSRYSLIWTWSLWTVCNHLVTTLWTLCELALSVCCQMQCRTTGLTVLYRICCRRSFWVLSAFLHPFTVLHLICQTALMVLKDCFF